MKQFKVRFATPEDVLEFTNRMKRYTYPMDMLKGARSVVDAKSLLGIIALGLDNILELRIYSDHCDGVEEVLEPYMAA